MDMDPITFAQLNEAYHKGVYSPEETLDIQEWVEALIDEGYDLDEYSDAELYEAYLAEVRGGGKVDPHNPDPSRGMKHSPYVKAGIKQVGIENQTIRRENEIRRKHKAPRVDPWEDPSDPDYREPPLRVVQATNRANRAAATDPKMRRLNKRYQTIGNVMDNMKEELDLYDLVSEYLVSEGFCDSYEDADVIMVNMSEEWRDGILDEVTGGGKIKFRKGLPGRSPKKAGMEMTPQQKAALKLGKMDVNPSTDPARRERQAKVALR
jgi:hypothetical protein